MYANRFGEGGAKKMTKCDIGRRAFKSKSISIY